MAQEVLKQEIIITEDTIIEAAHKIKETTDAVIPLHEVPYRITKTILQKQNFKPGNKVRLIQKINNTTTVKEIATFTEYSILRNLTKETKAEMIIKYIEIEDYVQIDMSTLNRKALTIKYLKLIHNKIIQQ